MRMRSLGLLGSGLCCAVAAGVSAQSVTLKNDFLVDGGTVAIQAGFAATEAGASLFRMPVGQQAQWQVRRVQIFWKSLFPPPGAPAEAQESISIWLPQGGPNGTRPQNLIFESDPPQLVDGFLNEFNFEQENPPVLVDAGSNFFAGLVFTEATNQIVGPSMVTDTAGCQPGKSWVRDIVTGWTELCTYRDLFGRPPSGTFVIRVVVAPYVAPAPPCQVDFDGDGFQTQEDLQGFITAWFDESILPGPFGLATPCPGLPAPYDQGMQIDFNRDCTFPPDQEDLQGFITEFLDEANPCPR